MSTQSNVIPLRDDARSLRRARGQFVDDLIRNDGRSARYVAIQVGISPTSMGERLKGKSPFLADELEGIARVLKMDPVSFYADYIAVGYNEGPDSDETGPDVPPTGIEPATYGTKVREIVSLDALRARRDATTLAAAARTHA